jgi:hypothetical protein
MGINQPDWLYIEKAYETVCTLSILFVIGSGVPIKMPGPCISSQQSSSAPASDSLCTALSYTKAPNRLHQRDEDLSIVMLAVRAQ